MPDRVKLPVQVDGRDAYVAELYNEDLIAVEELGDDLDELRRQRDNITQKIDAAEGEDDRRRLRSERRSVSRDSLALTLRLLSSQVVDENGDAFPPEAWERVPVRTQNALAAAVNRAMEADPTVDAPAGGS